MTYSPPLSSRASFLWEHSRIPAAELRRAGCPAWIEIDASEASGWDYLDLGTDMALAGVPPSFGGVSGAGLWQTPLSHSGDGGGVSWRGRRRFTGVAYWQSEVFDGRRKVVRESLALDPWPITASPDNFVLVVAGGGHPTNSYWLQGYSPGVIGRPIELPLSFEHLLAEAERDLGPR